MGIKKTVTSWDGDLWMSLLGVILGARPYVSAAIANAALQVKDATVLERPPSQQLEFKKLQKSPHFEQTTARFICTCLRK